MSFTFTTTVAHSAEELRSPIEDALKAEGFGVLTEIDVAATLKAKLGLDVPPFVILGACNPQLAARAIEADPSVGALLPCNVVLRESSAGTTVEILDPEAAFGVAQTETLAPIAADAAQRLRRVIDRVGSMAR
jgi:uncharacterized protein (DUF302 family)